MYSTELRSKCMHAKTSTLICAGRSGGDLICTKFSPALCLLCSKIGWVVYMHVCNNKLAVSPTIDTCYKALEQPSVHAYMWVQPMC